jgi:cob(I)alamin adenosyltransferase
MKVYTKSGDKGETSLVSGVRVAKSDPRIDLYGDVDELNSHIGLLASMITKESLGFELGLIYSIQNALFDLGSNLACPAEDREKMKLNAVSEQIISHIETEIDKIDKELPTLRNFILPGGTVVAAQAHVCRTVSRRVERKLVNFSYDKSGEITDVDKQFLNRLSDFFFVFARYVNMRSNQQETLWSPNER